MPSPQSFSASSLHTPEHELGNAPYTHAHMFIHTLTCEAFHFFTRKVPTVIDQNGHVQLHFPKERKLTGHLEPDAQPNPALCCPEQNQFCWQEDGVQLLGQPTGSTADHDPLSPSSPAEGFIFQKFKVETKGDDPAEYFRLPCRSMNSVPRGLQVRVYLYSYIKLEAVCLLTDKTNTE